MATMDIKESIQLLKGELAFVTDMYQCAKKTTDTLEARMEKIKKQIEELKNKRLKADYQILKEKHPDAVLLFRCGDFYESYEEDAVAMSVILGITLNMNKPNEGAWSCFTGFPHHALDVYLPKLIRAGKRVAICDELDF